MKRKNAVWQRAMYLVSKPNFINDIQTARLANGIPNDGFASEDELGTWLERQVYRTAKGNTLEESIDLAIAQIINKSEYALSPGWHHSIKRFMYLNNVDDMQLPIGLESRFIYDELTGRPTMHVVVTEDTAESDYVDHWKQIEDWRKREKLDPLRRGRKADQDILRRGRLAYDLWVSGKSHAEIARILEKQFPQLLKNELDVVSGDDAKTYIANFVKQSGI